MVLIGCGIFGKCERVNGISKLNKKGSLEGIEGR